MCLFVLSRTELREIGTVMFRQCAPTVMKAGIDAADHGEQNSHESFGNGADANGMFQFTAQKQRSRWNAL